MKALKVLHVIPGVSPRDGGPSRAVFEMCRALRARGCETLIATTDADGRGRRLPVELGGEVEYEGVPTVFFPRQLSEAFKLSLPLARWLDANVGSFDAVHIHAVFSHACLAAARACRARGVPYIVRPLGTLNPWGLSRKTFRKRVMWRLSAGRMMRGAARVHYTTPEERLLVEQSLGLGRGVVLPLGVEPEALHSSNGHGRFRQAHPSLGSNPYVLTLSRLHAVKNLESLLEVFLALVKQPEFTDWRLVLAGDGEAEYVRSLRRLVRERGGDEHVLFPGWLSGALKTSALRGASLLAVTSHQESFGVGVAEALACGVPVLLSREVGLAAEVERAGAGWVTERTRLACSLAEALRDGDERRRRGEAGSELASRRFSWPSLAAELIALYQSVAGDGSLAGPAAGVRVESLTSRP